MKKYVSLSIPFRTVLSIKKYILIQELFDAKRYSVNSSSILFKNFNIATLVYTLQLKEYFNARKRSQ